jgi:hypothetical protein
MKIIEKRNYEIQFSPAEVKKFRDVINLLDNLNDTDYFDYFRDDVVGIDWTFHIDSFRDIANFLDALLDDSTITPLA